MIKTKKLIPRWCEGCGKERYYYTNNIEDDVFLVCEACKKETSEVWCPNCGMGGSFVKNIEERPKYWVCPECNNRYELPKKFYHIRVNLHIKSHLSKEIKKPYTLVDVFISEIKINVIFWLIFDAIIFYTCYSNNRPLHLPVILTLSHILYIPIYHKFLMYNYKKKDKKVFSMYDRKTWSYIIMLLIVAILFIVQKLIW